MCPVDADHEDGGQSGYLDGHPHQADIVRKQSEVHCEQQHLIHCVVETKMGRRQPAGRKLMTDIAGAEQTRGEADEGIERHEDDVEIVDQKVRSGRWPVGYEERERRDEGEERGGDIQPRRQPVARQSREKACRSERNEKDRADRVELETGHRRSPRCLSSACTSTVSKRSRMRNRNMPITMKAMRIENATLISTTSGMPLAPVAASTSPFSRDMKPTTWLTALRRVTIKSSPSRTIESAKARSSRASGSAWAVTRSMTTMERATSPIPASMVGPMPTTVSISR